MKSFLLLIALFFVSTTAFASGKLMIQPNYFTDSGKVRPMFGLGVYEKFSFFKGAYNGWYGTGDQAFVGDKQDATWFTLRNAVDFYTKSPLVISPGVQNILIEGDSKWQHRIFVRASYDLW